MESPMEKRREVSSYGMDGELGCHGHEHVFLWLVLITPRLRLSQHLFLRSDLLMSYLAVTTENGSQ